MTVLVFGGRDFNDYTALAQALDTLHFLERRITKIVSGAARGADSLGEHWAQAHGVRIARYPADWREHRRAAGVIRNQQMLDEEHIDVAVACPGGKGTADMLRRLKKYPAIRVVMVAT